MAVDITAPVVPVEWNTLFFFLDRLPTSLGYYANRMGDAIANRQMAVLKSFPNVILSPHSAFYTEKVVWDMAYKSIKGVQDMMQHNENPLIVLK